MSTTKKWHGFFLSVFSHAVPLFHVLRRYFHVSEPPFLHPLSHRTAAVRLQRHRGQPYRAGEQPDRPAADAAGQRESAGALFSVGSSVLLHRTGPGCNAGPAVRRSHGSQLDVPVRQLSDHRRVHRVAAVLLLSGYRHGAVAAGVPRGADMGENHGLCLRLRRYRTGERLAAEVSASPVFCTAFSAPCAMPPC